jgi:hypothetical protein
MFVFGTVGNASAQLPRDGAVSNSTPVPDPLHKQTQTCFPANPHVNNSVPMAMNALLLSSAEHQFYEGRAYIHAMHACNVMMHVCMQAYMHTCMHTFMYACIHACMHAYMHTCMLHACMHACMCIHACIHAYMHAYIHVCMHT